MGYGLTQPQQLGALVNRPVAPWRDADLTSKRPIRPPTNQTEHSIYQRRRIPSEVIAIIELRTKRGDKYKSVLNKYNTLEFSAEVY